MSLFRAQSELGPTTLTERRVDELKQLSSTKTSLDTSNSTPGTGVSTSSQSPATVSSAEDDYVNPLETSSRWYLAARASAVRYAASFGFSLANRSDPPAPIPSRDIWLDSTLSQWKGRRKIKVEVWNPPRLTVGPRVAVIDFHGGGWILGQGTDDARWAGALMGALDAVVFTVNYRLAPGYPFPVSIEDCVDAVLQIAARADEFGIDKNRILLSGFSAGATMTLASWIVMQQPHAWDYKLPSVPPTIAGLVLFYPSLDLTISRAEKRQTCTRPELTLSQGLTDLIDASYVYPPVPRDKRADPRLSPGLMPDDLLGKLPPIHLCLCEHDMLLAEAVRFAKRLESHKKRFSIRIVDNEAHAWDKPPPLAPKESVAIEYGEAIEKMARWLGRDRETDTESVGSSKSKRLRLIRPRISLRSRSARA